MKIEEPPRGRDTCGKTQTATVASNPAQHFYGIPIGFLVLPSAIMTETKEVGVDDRK